MVLTVAFSVQKVEAGGAIYRLSDLTSQKARITISIPPESLDENGVAIAYYHLENGRVLHIGYEIKKGAPKKVSLDYDLAGAIPPIRINLIDINDQDWVPFNDIKEIDAKEYIIHLRNAGIIKGMPDGSFRPYNKITRAEFMVLIVKALNIEGRVENTSQFEDLEGHWARNIIMLASGHGLISGYEDGTIRPDNPISFAEVSSIISRAFSFKTTRNGIYSKLKKDMWYSDSVKRMFDVGVLSAEDSLYNTFAEDNPINRADCSMMISRALSTY